MKTIIVPLLAALWARGKGLVTGMCHAATDQLDISWLYAVTAAGGDFIALKVAVRWQTSAYWCFTMNPFFDAIPLPGGLQALCQRLEHDGYYYVQANLPHGSAATVRNNNP